MSAQRKRITATALAMALGLSLAGCADEPGTSPSGDSPSDSESPRSSDNAGGSGTPKDGSSAERGSDLAETEFGISWQDAVNTAMKSFDGNLAEVELDWSRDRYAYSIELVSAAEEYEVRIDADSGEKLSEQTEPIESDDVAEKTSEIVDPDEIISWDDALATALDAQNGTVNEWKLEGTDHGPQWQFDIDSDPGEDYEVTVDAETGELTAIDD